MTSRLIHPTRLARRGFLFGSAALALSACAVNYTAPTAKVAAAFDGDAPPRQARSDWWMAFNDATLNQLIAQGQARNLDIQQAVTAISAAEANAQMVTAGALPNVTIGAGASRSNQNGNGPISESSNGFGNVAWVLDVFGANRNARLAADARLDASWFSAEATRLLIEAAIAQSYIELRFHQAAMGLVRRSIASRKNSLELTQKQLALGAASQLDLLQAEQLLAEGQAALPAHETGFDQALARLASLTNSQSATLRQSLQKGAPQPRPTFKASVGVPADVVRLRPDVAVQERLFAAAAYDVGVAKAELLPSISLSGNIAPTQISGGSAFTPWSFGPSINLPIFTGGAKIANLRGSEARALQAHQAWEAAVLRAVEEVESALAAVNRDGRNVAARQKLVDTAVSAANLSSESYRIGEGSFFTVLDAERSALSAQQGLAQAQWQRAANYVTLALASAGGAKPAVKK